LIAGSLLWFDGRPFARSGSAPARRGGGSFCDGRSAYTDDPLDDDPTPAPPGCLMLMPPMR